MEWKTRLTELLGCRYPILQGAMAGFGNWQFAAAVAEAGAHGVITASVSRTPERLREDIRRCRDTTSKSFGVNLTIGICPRLEEMLKVCLEERVPVETALYRPDLIAPIIKESGVIWIHKSARLKDALHAEKLGADAVIVVGLEGIGRKNPEQLPTMISTTWGTRQIKIPFIAAGGIGDARGFLGALAMGADGIMMGTAFMATKEFPMKEIYKEAIVQARPDNPRLIQQILRTIDLKAWDDAMKMRDQVTLEKWLQMLRQASRKGSEEKITGGVLPGRSKRELNQLMSLAVGVIDHVSTVKELIDSITRGAEDILGSWQYLKPK